MKKVGAKRQRGSGMRPAPPLEVSWSCPIREGWYGHFCSDGTRVFVDQGEERGESRVAALDAATGTQLWTYPWPAGVLMAQDGVVLLATGHWEVHVVDAATGRPRTTLWGAMDIPRRRLPMDEPVAYVAVRGRHVVLFGTHPEHKRAMLRCFDLHTGQRNWTAWLESYTDGVVLTDSRVVVTQSRKEVRALDAATGRTCWTHYADSVKEPKTDGRCVFFPAAAPNHEWRTVALDLKDGRTLWGARRAVHWIGDGVLFGLSEENRIQATDAATGRRAGAANASVVLPASLRQFFLKRVLHVSESHVFVAAGHLGNTENTGALLCLDRKTAECLWVHRPGGEVYPCVHSADGRLIYRCGDCVYCLRQTT
jgi:outer membrane protein assembly factor BamB